MGRQQSLNKVLKGDCWVQQQLKNARSLSATLSTQDLANYFVLAEIILSGDDDCNRLCCDTSKSTTLSLARTNRQRTGFI